MSWGWNCGVYSGFGVQYLELGAALQNGVEIGQKRPDEIMEHTEWPVAKYKMCGIPFQGVNGIADHEVGDWVCKFLPPPQARCTSSHHRPTRE